MEIIKIILAIFVPPLAVFLEVGLGTQFWINVILVVLTLGIGAVIHALYVVLTR